MVSSDYSQHGEQPLILDYFKGYVGRFLDIGAFDGKTFSNTYALVERGWEGACVEPSPQVFPGLMRNHAANPKITLVNAAIEVEAGLRTFYSSPDAVSTLDQAHYELWKSRGQYTPVHVWTTAMADFLAAFPGPYDFINIDTEGTSVTLLLALPLGELGAKLICVEHDNRHADIEAFCEARGLTVQKRIACNTLLSR